MLSVDTSADRETTYIAAAGYREDGLPHVELIVRRDGMLWVPKYLKMLREAWPNIHEIALQSKAARPWTSPTRSRRPVGRCISSRAFAWEPQPAVSVTE